MDDNIVSEKAIVLVSGGMDSLVTVAIAAKECEELFFLHVNYGQLTESRELAAFNQLVAHYRPQDTMVCSIDYLKDIGNSSLIDRSIEMDTYKEAFDKQQDDVKGMKGVEDGTIPNTYVPFRNAHLLAIAVSWAEVIGANRIFIGAVEEDSSGYPDCREIFFKTYNEMIKYGTKNEIPIIIRTPLLHKSKKEIVLIGSELDVPFQFSWSCYQDNNQACGVCPSCLLRLKAFKEAGITDPILYR
jgi:7-cyano-7-deazaguanine synthase